MEQLINQYYKCKKDKKCNAFNKEPEIICGNALICQLIHYYEGKIYTLKSELKNQEKFYERELGND
jgi:hypothetical protein